MLKQVLLPAPFGPISASISPAGEREGDVGCTATHAAEGLAEACRPSTAQDGAGSCRPLPRASHREGQRLQAADQPAREEQHQQDDRGPRTSRQ
jgi:hypothetical protein